ncbi:unnamed protein product [Ectocarpus sp. 12 AP-2014]
MSTFAGAPEVTTTTQQQATTATAASLRGSTPEAVVTAATNGSSSSSATTSELAEDGYPKDMEIPIRYVKGMEGDVVEARRRWIATLKWREEEKVDGILDEACPHFDIIKKYYPHFYFKHAKNGSVVYYEIPGKIDLNKLRENGLDMDSLCRHYVYITEFLWKELDKNPEGKLFTCMDMKGTKLSMFAGEVKEFLLRSAKMVGAHYPERSYKIFILNAPWWFSVVWKFVTPFVHPNTRAKVVVCGGNFLEKMGELIDLENVPQDVGGQDPTPPLQGPQELQMQEHVVKVLKEKGMEMKPIR